MAPVNSYAARAGHRLGAVLCVLSVAILALPNASRGQDMDHMHHGEAKDIPVMPSGSMIMHMIRDPMLPGSRGLRPSVSEFLPGAGIDPATLPIAGPREIVDLAHGDTLALEASLVRKMVAGETFVMYAFNEQIPGPLIRVKRGSEVHVRFTNRIDMETTVHWHGLRLENRFDGVPGLTQDPASRTTASTGITRTCGRTSSRTWGCTETCWCDRTASRTRTRCTRSRW